MLLLVVIYLSFISLGLPDTLLGSAWPVMQLDLNMPASAAGLLTMITTAGTVIASLFSGRIIKRLGTGPVTAFSVLMTAVALVGNAFAPGYWWLCLLAVLLGLGAGTVDVGLNNFVALHYKARHMNWLHCFWGVGATAGPMIMSLFLTRPGGWRLGYGTIGGIQLVVMALLFLSLPLWKRMGGSGGVDQSKHATQKLKELVKIKGVPSAMLCFFCYCGLEGTTGIWGSTFLVTIKGLSADTAAQWGAIYYLGITVGRFISGFISVKLNNNAIIRLGLVAIGIGILLVLLPLGTALLLPGFALIGLGCAPIFPSMIHETPVRFGKALSQSLIGLQMASAYVGYTLVPPIFGLIGEHISFGLWGVYLLGLWIVMFILAESLARRIKPAL